MHVRNLLAIRIFLSIVSEKYDKSLTFREKCKVFKGTSWALGQVHAKCSLFEMIIMFVHAFTVND